MKINLAKEQAYARIALDRCRIMRRVLAPSQELVLPTICPNTPGWAAWRHYFEYHLGFLPIAMQRTLDSLGSGQFTVPCQWPQQMDASYTPPSRFAPPPPSDPSAHLSLPQRSAIVKRIKDEIANAKLEPLNIPKPKASTLYTEDELRRMYPPPTPKDSSHDPSPA
jgi:hypothetical protein